MNLEKNIIEIVKRENKNLDKSLKDLDLNFSSKYQSKLSNNIYENIISMIVGIMIKIIIDMDKFPVTKRIDNKLFQEKALTDSQLVGLVVFVGLFHIFALQNLKKINKSRISEDNTKLIAAIFFLEDLTKNKDNITIISHGTKQISKMTSHEDKMLRKILDTFRVIVDDYIKNKGVITSKLKSTFPSFVKAFRFYFDTITKMYE